MMIRGDRNMRARSPSPSLAILAALAVGCEQRVLPQYTDDIRIDAASPSNDPDSFGTQMCATTNGSAAVVYVLFMDERDVPEGGRADIWLNRSLDLGVTWLPAPIRVNHGDGSAVYAPTLHCSGSSVYVVWEDDRNGDLRNHDIYFNRSDDAGETFLAEDVLLEDAADGLSMSIHPRIAGDGDQLYVVWADNAAGAYDIHATMSPDGGQSWATTSRLDSDIAGASFSGAAALGLGRGANEIYVAWEDARDEGSDVYVARSTDGGLGYEKEDRVDVGDPDGVSNAFEPAVCVGDNGYAYVVWHDDRHGEAHDIYVNYTLDRGEHWLGAFRLETDAPGVGNSLDPVCTAHEARLHVAWREKRAETFAYDVFYRQVNAGIPVGAEVRLDVGIPEEGIAESRSPVMAIDSGTVLVAWREARGEAAAGTDAGYEELYYNYAELGGTFDTESDYRIDSTVDGTTIKSDLSVALIGSRWMAAWTDDRNGTDDVYFQSMPLGEQADPPTLEELTAK
jgi:hypothetical protein